MLAVIGGSGLNQISHFTITEQTQPDTPFGQSAIVRRGQFENQSHEVLFMPRHGEGHNLPPHLINYRANLWALKERGASTILGVNAVGGIRADMEPGTIVIPDQLIDYTYGRDHTFFTGDSTGVQHIDFTRPFHEHWRQQIITAAAKEDIAVITEGTYACSQGPRLETAAEIQKLKRDGCDVVGMTGMPEAALARELDLKYCALNLVVNWGAGLSAEVITMEMIAQVLTVGMVPVTKIIQAASQEFGAEG